MGLLLFRKCTKVIPNTWEFDEKLFNKDFSNILGFYCVGMNQDILGLYVEGGNLKLSLNEKIFDPIEVNYLINQKSEKIWEFIIESTNEMSAVFSYQPYNYYPHEDDSQEDVNFGLWIKSIIENEDKRLRFISIKKGRS